MKNKDPFDDQFFKDPDKYMKSAKNKMIKYVSIMMILLIVSVCWLQFLLGKEKESIEEKIGKTFTLEKDTLLIVDYSSWKETYTLSNGREVSFELVNKSK